MARGSPSSPTTNSASNVSEAAPSGTSSPYCCNAPVAMRIRTRLTAEVGGNPSLAGKGRKSSSDRSGSSFGIVLSVRSGFVASVLAASESGRVESGAAACGCDRTSLGKVISGLCRSLAAKPHTTPARTRRLAPQAQAIPKRRRVWPDRRGGAARRVSAISREDR